jgi:hypothetical protein
MNRSFIVGFIDELEKKGFFEKKDVNSFQGQMKKMHLHLVKHTHTGTPAQDKDAVHRPGSAVTAATSMCGDIGQKIKRLKPIKAKK